MITQQKLGANLKAKVADYLWGTDQSREHRRVLSHRASYRTPCFGTTLMRHFCYLSFTIAALPCSVIQPPLWTILVPFGRSSSSFPTRRQRTVVAIDVASITATANHSLSMASGAVVKSRSVLNPFWPSHGHDDESTSLERFW